MPTVAPGFNPASAFVIFPTARTVWTSSSGRAGSPLMEIADSPTPKR